MSNMEFYIDTDQDYIDSGYSVWWGEVCGEGSRRIVLRHFASSWIQILYHQHKKAAKPRKEETSNKLTKHGAAIVLSVCQTNALVSS
jgi:hypothetical protein